MTAFAHFKTSAYLAAIGLLLCSACLAPAQAQSVAPAPAPAASAATKADTTYKRGDHITLNFNAADIEAVARTMGVISGMNVVVDPRVRSARAVLESCMPSSLSSPLW